MKAQRIFSFVLLASVILLSVEVMAQRGARGGMRQDARPQQRALQDERQQMRGQGIEYCTFIPDLTDEQIDAISDLRTEKLKKSTDHRNQMAELRARKRTLMTSDSPDMTKIDAIIDQMTDLRKAQLKSNARHHQQVRGLLTDEQKVYFDARGQRGRGNFDGRRGGRGMRR